MGAGGNEVVGVIILGSEGGHAALCRCGLDV